MVQSGFQVAHQCPTLRSQEHAKQRSFPLRTGVLSQRFRSAYVQWLRSIHNWPMTAYLFTPPMFNARSATEHQNRIGSYHAWLCTSRRFESSKTNEFNLSETYATMPLSDPHSVDDDHKGRSPPIAFHFQIPCSKQRSINASAHLVYVDGASTMELSKPSSRCTPHPGAIPCSVRTPVIPFSIDLPNESWVQFNPVVLDHTQGCDSTIFIFQRKDNGKWVQILCAAECCFGAEVSVAAHVESSSDGTSDHTTVDVACPPQPLGAICHIRAIPMGSLVPSHDSHVSSFLRCTKFTFDICCGPSAVGEVLDDLPQYLGTFQRQAWSLRIRHGLCHVSWWACSSVLLGEIPQFIICWITEVSVLIFTEIRPFSCQVATHCPSRSASRSVVICAIRELLGRLIRSMMCRL